MCLLDTRHGLCSVSCFCLDPCPVGREAVQSHSCSVKARLPAGRVGRVPTHFSPVTRACASGTQEPLSQQDLGSHSGSSLCDAHNKAILFHSLVPPPSVSLSLAPTPSLILSYLQVQIVYKPVDLSKVTSKCGSLGNIHHKPGSPCASRMGWGGGGGGGTGAARADGMGHYPRRVGLPGAWGVWLSCLAPGEEARQVQVSSSLTCGPRAGCAQSLESPGRA